MLRLSHFVRCHSGSVRLIPSADPGPRRRLATLGLTRRRHRSQSLSRKIDSDTDKHEPTAIPDVVICGSVDIEIVADYDLARVRAADFFQKGFFRIWDLV